jgi:hypothetical protein
MRRVLCFLIILVVSVALYAQGGQDFASRFMQKCKEDTSVHCVTVSPKMMGQMLKTHNNVQDENITRVISKLKSARIITVNHHGEEYYQIAAELMDKNKSRFQHDKAYHNSHSYGCFYTRIKKGVIVELVMLHVDGRANQFMVVNLTGTIDEEFISNMTKTMGSRTARLR